MKAWVIDAGDGSAPAQASLRFADVEEPRAGAGELLLEIRAVGLNRADLSRRAGHYERIATRPPAPIAGLEAAGTVMAVGPGVEGFSPGDRVMGMPSGAYAERALLDARLAMRVPAGMAWTDAAALPVATFTAHDALVTAGRLRPGDTVLVQGASSGVGIAALQIARWLRAARVIGTASSPSRIEALRAYGLTDGIERPGAVAEQVMAITGGRGADVVIDMAGGGAIADSLGACALGARWVQVGRMGGPRGEIDLDLLSRKRVSLVGVTFRTRGVVEFAAVVRNAEHDLSAALAAREIAMPLSAVFPFAEAESAQQAMRSNEHLGKIVLQMP